MGITTVVFDLGGVVLGSPLEGIAIFEKEFGIPLGFINVSIASRSKHGAFQRLERGELSMEQFYKEFRQELGDPSNIPLYVAYLKKKGRPVPQDLPASIDIDTVKLFEYMMQKARAINRNMCHALFLLRGMGYKVCALTNNWQLDEGDASSKPKDSSSTNLLAAFFDEIIESSIVGLRKPDPKIYALTCEIMKCEPTQVAFLDDIGMNLSAAKKFGWTTIKVDIGKADVALQNLANVLGLRNDAFVPSQTKPTFLQYKAGALDGVLAMDLYGSAVDPMILFFHGGGQTRFAWETTATMFAKAGYCAVVVDMKGHGQSYWDTRPVEGRYKTSEYSADLDRLVRIMKLDRRPTGFGLVGASLGGLTILESHFAKDLARAVVLVDITPRMEVAGVTRIVSWMKKTAATGFASLEEAAQAIAEYNPRRTDETQSSSSNNDRLRGLKKNLRETKDGRWTWHWDPEFLNTRMASAENLSEYEQEVYAHASTTKTPCLLVRGRETDLVSVEAAEAFVQKMPNAKYIDIEEAAHMVVGDRNDIFAAETLKFLQQHIPSQSSKL